jgi:hypothetical protein
VQHDAAGMFKLNGYQIDQGTATPCLPPYKLPYKSIEPQRMCSTCILELLLHVLPAAVSKHYSACTGCCCANGNRS